MTEVQAKRHFLNMLTAFAPSTMLHLLAHMETPR